MDENTRKKFSLRTLNFGSKLTTLWEFYFTDSFLELCIFKGTESLNCDPASMNGSIFILDAFSHW